MTVLGNFVFVLAYDLYLRAIMAEKLLESCLDLFHDL